MDVAARVAEQLRHQGRLATARRAPINWVFAAGLLFSLLALIPLLLDFRARGSPWGVLAFLLFFSLLFAYSVFQWLAWPWFLRPRIVVCFARELEPYGGATSGAFWRGRALYLDLEPLEALAARLGVRPLSAYGFTDDFYAQTVSWHPAAEGLATIEALRRGLDDGLRTRHGLVEDLDAMATILRAAAGKNVDFCLLLRLTESDSLQMVCTREERQGRFW